MYWLTAITRTRKRTCSASHIQLAPRSGAQLHPLVIPLTNNKLKYRDTRAYPANDIDNVVLRVAKSADSTR